MLCWRNTSLEDVHAGGERADALEWAGLNSDDPSVAEQEQHASADFFATMNADRDALANTDPDEVRRIEVFLEGRE